MTQSEALSWLDQKEQEERFLYLSNVGWEQNEILGQEVEYLAADERGEDDVYSQ